MDTCCCDTEASNRYRFFGDLRAYIVESFSPKVRDVFFNEVRGAQDITDFSIHLPFRWQN